MEVLTLQQAGFISWSKSKKNKCLFATASLYDSFSASDAPQDDALLQLHSFDIVNKTSSSQKVGVASFQGANFTSIDWDNFGENDRYHNGIIATGFSNGVVGLWDPNTIIQNHLADPNGNHNERGLLSLQEIHEAPVNTIAFNPFRQHLIASGGVEVIVQDLQKDISEPEVFSPGSDVHQRSPITSVSWNRKVPHILGSASQNGISVVWDLKLNQSIFNFSDPSRVAQNRNVCLSWNPEIPTQIAVVYDDAKVPELQIWDLRNPKGPIFCTAKGHTKGIHYLDWSITDPSLIVTVGRDNKACIWNYKLSSDNLVSEFNLNEPASQVKWSPRQPEIYSVSNVSGTSTIYSLNNQLDHIPAWIRPPVGARFGFDGRLAVFSEKSGFNVKQYKVKNTDEVLEPYIQEFEQNFSNTNIDLQKLAQNRFNSELLSDQERQQWAFILAAAKNDNDDIVEALGFDKINIIKKAENYTSKYYITRATTTTTHKVESDFKMLTAEEAEDFFGNLGRKGSKDVTGRLSASMAEVDDDYTTQENITKNTNWNAGIEKIIKTNMLIGNIEGAVDSALKCGRVAEALLLAYAKGGEFFKSTIKSYVTSSNDPFVKNVIRYLVEDQIEDLVLNYSLDDWKECVALCINLPTNFKGHMEQLANRFIQERNDYDTAMLCYILSKNFTKILETFALASERYQRGSTDHTIFLINTVEKIIGLRILVGYYEPNSIVDRFLFELSKVLQAHGKEVLILNLLTINDSFGFECLVIRDRLLNSSPELQKLFAAKQFPFHRETVNVRVKKAKAIEPVKKVPDHIGGPKSIGHIGGHAGPFGGNPPVNEQVDPRLKEAPPIHNKPGPGPLTKPGFDPTKKKEIAPPNLPNKGGPPTGFPKGNTGFPPVADNRGPQEIHPNELHPSSKPVIPGPGKFIPPVNTTTFEKKPFEHTEPTNLPSGGTSHTISGGPTFKGPSGPGFPKPGLPKPMTGPGIGGPGGFTNPISGPIGGGPISNPLSSSTSGLNKGGPTGGFGAPMGGFKPGVVENKPNEGPTGFPKPNIGVPPARITGPGAFGAKVNQASIPNPELNKFVPKMGGSTPTGNEAPVKQDPAEILSNYQPVIDCVKRGLELLDQIDQYNPKKKAEMEQKMSTLYDILVAGTMKPVTIKDLTKLCQALDSGDMHTANILQQKIDREDYVKNKDWLYVTRRIVARK